MIHTTKSKKISRDPNLGCKIYHVDGYNLFELKFKLQLAVVKSTIEYDTILSTIKSTTKVNWEVSTTKCLSRCTLVANFTKDSCKQHFTVILKTFPRKLNFNSKRMYSVV